MKIVTPVRQLGALVALAAGAVLGVAACSDGGSASIETLPSIRTTTTVPTTVPPPTTRPDTYEVESGESLSDVAEKFGVSWIELAEHNGIDDPDYVRAGDVLRLPPLEGENGEGGGGQADADGQANGDGQAGG